jgi:hypothetical protein
MKATARTKRMGWYGEADIPQLDEIEATRRVDQHSRRR